MRHVDEESNSESTISDSGLSFPSYMYPDAACAHSRLPADVEARLRQESREWKRRQDIKHWQERARKINERRARRAAHRGGS